ncbi:MAG: DNA internalization-related competence protein ComEC/Rec2 [Polyangiaceae bacterium]
MRLEGLALASLALLFGAVLPAYPALVGLTALLLVDTCLGLSRTLKAQKVELAFAVVALLLQAGRGAAVMEAHAEARAKQVERHRHPALCDGEGEVARSPSFAGSLRLELRAIAIRCDGSEERFASDVRLYVESPDEEFARGDGVAFISLLAVPEVYANDAVEHPRLSLAAREIVLTGGAPYVHRTRRGTGIRAWVDRARNHVRRRIRATFSRDTEALARALMLGETDLDPAESERFRSSGLAHLLAVSGVHLAIAVGASVRLLRRGLSCVTWLSERVDVARLASALGVPLAWLYADFAGGSGSATRAAIMLSVSYAAIAWGRRTSAARALSWSAAFAALFDPFVMLDASFSLSLVATAGLATLAAPITNAIERILRWKAAATSLGATLAATVSCVPVLSALGSSVPLAGVPLNIVAVPVGEVAALPLCLLHGVLSPFPAFEGWAAQAAGGALRLVDALAAIGSRVRGFELPPPTPIETCALLGAFAAFVVLGEEPKRRAAVVLLTALLLVLAEVHACKPPGALRVTFLDVGQGDSAVIETPNGAAIVVDGGGLVGSPTDIGRRVLRPYLRARRIREVTLVVLSHPHPDHFGGLASGTKSAHVRAVWDSALGRKDGVQGAYAAWRRQMEDDHAAMPPEQRFCGEHRVDGVVLHVLAPCPSFSEGRGTNDNSIVFRVTYGSRRILFVGDAEHEEEEDLLRTHAYDLPADVLKVGHHGSRTSSSEAFLAAVTPRVAVISCGVRNRFGHPHETTLDKLARSAASIYRTDRGGAVTVETDGHSLAVRTAY